ncbi:type II toxin-antitoxin system RelE/ParE family toxin [Candidatus Shapirobacteria bacterium]|nr:type II toxin-antitoxin system RelE/ParE family toxin [Candidatus Shapirobacteria bacterium]
MYKAVLGRRVQKVFKKIPKKYQLKIKEAISKVEKNPFCYGTIKLAGSPVAEYRHRVGDYRILFDLWEEKKVLMILDIKRRTSTTY